MKFFGIVLKIILKEQTLVDESPSEQENPKTWKCDFWHRSSLFSSVVNLRD